MAKMLKTRDLYVDMAARIFELYNPGKVKVGRINGWNGIITDVQPNALVYPEGWYYAKGCFRNKHTNSTGMYSEMGMFKSNGKMWNEPYCTLPDNYPMNY